MPIKINTRKPRRLLHSPREAASGEERDDNQLTQEEYEHLWFNLMDVWPKHTSHSELLVLLFISKRTLRFRKKWERISLRDMLYGIPKSEYRGLFGGLKRDFEGTMKMLKPDERRTVEEGGIYFVHPIGLSMSNIQLALKSLENRHFIHKAVYPHYIEYSLSFEAMHGECHRFPTKKRTKKRQTRSARMLIR